MAPPEAEIDVARRLVRQAGLDPDVKGLERLAGGRNNRVFKLDLADGRALALKIYFVHPDDPRDRLAAEWSFLEHAWSRGVRSVPQPLAIDRSAHAALLTFISGHSLTEDEITAAHVDAAAEFVVATNTPRHCTLAPASEACFSLAEHVATIERRVRALGMLDPMAPPGAERFVRDQLWPAWSAVKARIERRAADAGFALAARVNEDDVIASPSDFGFHNAILRADGSLTFIDFEYAGRDDAAKLVCDFMCQPRIPAPAALRDGFARRIAQGLASPSFATRASLLLEGYRVKWICIILNELLPLGAARRAFSNDAAREERCVAQLASAQAKLAEITL